jgi:hypothetical membrane protein
MVFSAWQGILAVILIVLWAVRRHETAYGALAAAMALGAIQAFLPTAVDQTAHPELSATVIASSAPLESGFVLAFAILFFGRRWPRYGPLMFVPGVLLVLIGIFGIRKRCASPSSISAYPALASISCCWRWLSHGRRCEGRTCRACCSAAPSPSC